MRMPRSRLARPMPLEWAHGAPLCPWRGCGYQEDACEVSRATPVAALHHARKGSKFIGLGQMSNKSQSCVGAVLEC